MTTLACFRGMADRFKDSVECGVIYGKGEIEGHPVILEAYEMGRSI